MKIKKAEKKKNCNKDKNIKETTNKELRVNEVYLLPFSCVNSNHLKSQQLILKEKFNVKIHMNDLRNLYFLEPEDTKIGNSTVKKVKEYIKCIKPTDITFTNKLQHDITKWKSSKKTQRIKNTRRDAKFDFANI